MSHRTYELTEEEVAQLISDAIGKHTVWLQREFASMEARLMQAVGGAALQQHLDRELQRMEEGLARAVGAEKLHELAMAVGELNQRLGLASGWGR